MPKQSPHLLAIVIGILPAAAQGAPLAPHQAVYDLSLAAKTDELQGVEGRIALQLKSAACGIYDLDYRFVARYEDDEAFTLTDQQTLSRESARDGTFRFETKTFVDGSEQGIIRGSAHNGPDATAVSLEEPVVRTFDLPPSLFPMSHVSELIDKALGGETLVETRFFDGGDDAEKLLTTTAIITPLSADERTAAGFADKLSDMKAWRVNESYFNADSDPDGLPVFETRYILYENGVSDDLYMDFGDYALQGGLGRLDYYDRPSCP